MCKVLPGLDFKCYPVLRVQPSLKESFKEVLLGTNFRSGTRADQKKGMVKLHRHLGHVQVEWLVGFLRSTGVEWHPEMERDLNEVVEDCLGCFQRKENQDPPEYGGDRETKSSKEVTMLGDDSDRTDYEGHISVDENPEGESEKMTDIPNGFVRNDDEDIFAEAKSDNRDNQADISNNQAVPRTTLRKKIRAKISGLLEIKKGG
jgi:hypothetical protein